MSADYTLYWYRPGPTPIAGGRDLPGTVTLNGPGHPRGPGTGRCNLTALTALVVTLMMPPLSVTGHDNEHAGLGGAKVEDKV